MGITFRHDAAAGLIGAYAAGQSSGRRRRSKYGMGRRQRMLPTGATRRAVAGKQPEGQWADPLAQPKLEGQDAVTQRARRRARARKYRMGKDIPAEWQPTFTSQDEIKAKREQDQKDAEWKRDVADEERINARERREDIEDIDEANRRKGIAGQILPVPDHLQRTKEGNRLGQLNATESDIRKKRNFDQDDEGTKAALAEIAEERQQILKDNPKPSLAGKFNEGTVFVDGAGLAHDEPGPGRRAVDAESRQAIEFTSPEDVAATAAQEKQEAAAEKKQTRRNKIIDNRAARRTKDDYINDEEGVRNAVDKEYQDQLDELDALNEEAPPPAEAPVQAQPQTAAQQADAEARRRAGLGQQRGVPTGRQAGLAPKPGVEAAVRAAQSGDVDAQRALDERNIPWR